MNEYKINRRKMIEGLFALYGAGTLIGCGRDESASKKISAATNKLSTDLYTERHRAFLRRLADIIISKTDTPGALEAGAPDSLEQVLLEWMDDKSRKEWLEGMSEIAASLDKSTQGDFMQASPEMQTQAVNSLDIAAYGDGSASIFYKEFKTSLGAAYYLSEIGATQELRYEAVPGEWKACIPFEEIGRTWAV